MRLRKLELTNFKNHISILFHLTKKFVAFTGLNGSGKTNLLDAIYYLCFTKSYFQNIEKNNVNHDAYFFRITSNWEDEDGNDIPIEVRYDLRDKKKKILFDEVLYRKLSEHIGKIPVVMVAPDDQIRILLESGERRNYLDTLVSQINTKYYEHLNHYNRNLKQRNAALKEFAENQYFDGQLIATYDEKLIESGTFIFNKRKEITKIINGKLNDHYRKISKYTEEASLKYSSQLLDKPMDVLLRESIETDKHSIRTTKGIHRDDLELSLNNFQLKKYGSQGQQKSFLLGMKLTQLDILYEHNNIKPLIIVDDIFAKLDEERVQSLIDLLHSDHIAQVFISDTSKNRIEHIFDKQKTDIEVFELGKIKHE